MIIIITKDGRVLTDDGNPVEGISLDGAAVLLADPKDGDSIVYNASAGMWVPGNPFPVSITEPEDGDTLAYDAESGTWKNVHAADGGGNDE